MREIRLFWMKKGMKSVLNKSKKNSYENIN
ncbi:hypothetical protein IX310_000306 [Bacteroides pyogenes]|nr:hypothetical protein [Bacteroides pyogenes]